MKLLLGLPAWPLPDTADALPAARGWGHRLLGLFGIVALLLSASIAAHAQAPGTLDPGFNASANNIVCPFAVQPDGKVILGGDFDQINGVARNHVARLNSDGTLDPGLSVSVNNTVNSLTLQPDGKIILGGFFTHVNGVNRSGIARLNADGTLDSGFNPSGVRHGFGAPFTVAVQPDGKTLLGGNFIQVNGVTRNGIARLYGGASDPAPPQVITGVSSVNVQVSQPFLYSINATDSPTSYGATGLPPGLVINPATGLISGTPTQPGSYAVTLSATNAVGTGTATLPLSISALPPEPPVITSAGSASAMVGQPFSYQITATNNPTRFSSPGLPPGLSINPVTGLISGTPTQAGPSILFLGASNSGGEGRATLALTIAPLPTPLPVITSATSAGGQVGQPFFYRIEATNLPTRYDVVGLPTSLSLISPAVGAITGTPTEIGSFLVTVSATNGGGTSTITLTLTISPFPSQPPAITSAASATAQVGQPFNFQLTATNSPASFVTTGLPLGLSLDGDTGRISGTPTLAGAFSIALSATNVAGTGTASLTLSISAAGVPPLLLAPATLSQVNFDGRANGSGTAPAGALLLSRDGFLYGTTTGRFNSLDAGTIFRVSPATGELTTLLRFNLSNGSAPNAPLVQSDDGSLYGTTGGGGGAGGYGTVFRLAPNGELTTLAFFNLNNGAEPRGGLVIGPDGAFYGTTARSSDPFGAGTVFRITPTGELTTLASLRGLSPRSTLALGPDGAFYGAAGRGANTASGEGTLFRVTLTGQVTTLHAFHFTDGADPTGLVLGSDGLFYGTTSNGGSRSVGTLFRITPAGELTTLVNFEGSNGANPGGTLVEGPDGAFYGTTINGGGTFSQGRGTIYKVNPTTGGLTTLFSFGGADGSNPSGALTLAPDGLFYGTTSSGGSTGANAGTVFRLSAPTVSVSVDQPTISRTAGQVATVTFTRNGGDLSQKIVVAHTLSGTLLGGNDYATLSGTKKIKAGKASVSLQIVPLAGGANGKLTLKLAPGVGYTIGSPAKATVKITN